jgi:hypothetical protein
LSAKTIHHGLIGNFYFPILGNVLPMLLSAACTLSKNIFLWGFDGRAPGDTLFWNHSPKHDYPEFMPGLQKAHPAFFNHLAPTASNPLKYVELVHGDELEHSLHEARKAGWEFTMLHQSWTPLLQKLYKSDGHE